jgi:RimJ/RimL family protein N-acetyltransferase
MSSILSQISDARVQIRPFTQDDVLAHVAGDDPEQIKWLSGGPSTVEGTSAWIARNQEYWQKGGPVFNFAVVDLTSGRLAGMVEANIDWQRLDGLEDGDANISYGLYPAFRGQGIISHAIRLLESFLKQQGVKRTVIRVEPDNEASLTVPLKHGYIESDPITTSDDTRMRLFRKEL